MIAHHIVVEETESDSLSHANAARFLNVNYNRLVYAVHKGWLPCHMDEDGNRRYKKEDLIKFAEQRNIKI